MSSAGPDHERWEDSVGAYLLSALPEREEIDFERHMSGCAICRDQIEDLRVATDALALAALPITPPADLRARVMHVVEQEAELLRAAGPDADRPERSPARRSRFRLPSAGWLLRPAFALPAAVLLLAVGAVIGLAGSGAFSGDDAARTVKASVVRKAAPNARVSLEITPNGSTLVAEHLPDPPEGRVYQVWVKRPNLDPEPTSTLFMPRKDGSAAAAVPGSLDGMEAVLVTHEPAGGSPTPTSQPMITATLPA